MSQKRQAQVLTPIQALFLPNLKTPTEHNSNTRHLKIPEGAINTYLERIQVTTISVQAYRELTQTLKYLKIPFHTYCLLSWTWSSEV